MPSLRKRVSSYFRQLSFHHEPREKRHNINENAFVTKYLQGLISLKEGPPIVYGKNPSDLPSYEVEKYDCGPNTVVACYSGPHGGLTTVKRTEKHLSIPDDDDIDFIDTPNDDEPIFPPLPRKSPKRIEGCPIDNTTMVIKVAGHEYSVINKPKPKTGHSRSHSLGSMAELGIEIEKTKINKSCDIKKDENFNETKKTGLEGNNVIEVNAEQKSKNINCGVTLVNNVSNQPSSVHKSHNKPHMKQNDSVKKSTEERKSSRHLRSSETSRHRCNEQQTGIKHGLAKSKSDGNPFQHKKRGRIIQIERPKKGDDSSEGDTPRAPSDDTVLPPEWKRFSNLYYGISDSLYDKNQVSRQKNGDPIADCFGIIARKDSTILAVADGVNWGEKASVAAKSAVHGALHYLNKTIFNDTKPFEKLTTKTEDLNLANNLNPNENLNLIKNTKEVFVCLLRAFNCAHDLILENKGMLTTLTVAVVLPLRVKQSKCENGLGIQKEPQYVCCVCNVGDTLAYVYSQKYGVRELTKGSHDVNSNRDMRDALGALGPVDGIKPELSNLTLSITTITKGDIVLVASDGLTDNFDPNVCKFTVVSSNATKSKKTGTLATSNTGGISQKLPDTPTKPPVKPPRKSKNRDSLSSVSQSERSSSSLESRSSAHKNNSDLNSCLTQPETSSNVPFNDSKRVDPLKNDGKPDLDYENPLIAHFMQQNSIEEDQPSPLQEPKLPKTKLPSVVENRSSSLRKISSHTRSGLPLSAKNSPISAETARKTRTEVTKFLRSKTSLDFRASNAKPVVLRNEDGIPYVTPLQRYELQLLLMEDILKHGISDRELPVTDARQLCENLVSFTTSITAAKRRTLEDEDMYFENRNGVLIEVSNQEKKMRRKRGLEKVQGMPGKLDHVTVVACNVGNFAF